jgi:hypothetical protein
MEAFVTIECKRSMISKGKMMIFPRTVYIGLASFAHESNDAFTKQ